MMAEEFRYALIIAGVLGMAALVIHGLWSARKNSHETKSRFFQVVCNWARLEEVHKMGGRSEREENYLRSKQQV